LRGRLTAAGFGWPAAGSRSSFLRGRLTAAGSRLTRGRCTTRGREPSSCSRFRRPAAVGYSSFSYQATSQYLPNLRPTSR
jgi:hypothetical protein